MPETSAPPRIGFNALLMSASGDFRAAGLHRYTHAMLQALADEPGIAVSAYTADASARATLPAAIDVRPAPALARRRAGRIVWEQLGLPVALVRAKARLYHGAAYAMPALCPVPAVVTVHDLSFIRMPGAFPPLQARYLRLATSVSARRAAALIAVSEFTGRELVRLLGVPAERVHVVPNGCDPRCRPLPPADVAAFRARAGLPERFILAVGTLQPRKNLETLLRAYALLRRDWDANRGNGHAGDEAAGAPPALVVAGAPGWGRVDVRAHAAGLGVAEHLYLPGFVPEADLPALYNAALCLAFPSRYEGFGLPALEAMACGTPVVVSDATSLPEVVGDAGLRVPPDDVAGWAAALLHLATDAPARRALAERGPARATGFTWQRAASQTAAVWRTVLSAPQPVARAASSAR